VPAAPGDAARDLRGWARFGNWAAALACVRRCPARRTLVAHVIAAAAMGAVALAAYPLLVTRWSGRSAALPGTPCWSWALDRRSHARYLCLPVLGPSMLPAILALALHNGAIIAHRSAARPTPCARAPTGPRGLDLYAWDDDPLLYGSSWPTRSIARRSCFARARSSGARVRTLGFSRERHRRAAARPRGGA